MHRIFHKSLLGFYKFIFYKVTLCVINKQLLAVSRLHALEMTGYDLSILKIA